VLLVAMTVERGISGGDKRSHTHARACMTLLAQHVHVCVLMIS